MKITDNYLDLFLLIAENNGKNAKYIFNKKIEEITERSNFYAIDMYSENETREHIEPGVKSLKLMSFETVKKTLLPHIRHCSDDISRLVTINHL